MSKDESPILMLSGCVTAPESAPQLVDEFIAKKEDPVEFLRLAVQPTVESWRKAKAERPVTGNQNRTYIWGQRILPRSLSMNHRAPAKANSYPVQKREEPQQSRRAPFPIVGVGASAGGLEAFTQLLKALPSRTGMAYVLVQHLDPTHEGALTELLARATEMPVRQVTDAMPVEPNRVYVIPPNVDMVISQGILRLTPRTETRGHHMPIDRFLRSLAEDKGSNAIGVILSGTASDGTLGLAAIKGEGGIIFAQDEKSAKYDGMPESAIAAGCVDLPLFASQ